MFLSRSKAKAYRGKYDGANVSLIDRGHMYPLWSQHEGMYDAGQDLQISGVTEANKRQTITTNTSRSYMMY